MSNLKLILIQKGLSNRQVDIGYLVTQGHSNLEICNQLGVTERGLKMQLARIYKTMHVKSRAQFIVWCLPHLGYSEVQP